MAGVERSEAIGQLAAALAKAQGQMRGAEKDAVNPHFKSKYADLASIWASVRGPLAANGLAVVQVPNGTENTVGLTTILAHSSGEWVSSYIYVTVPSRAAQIIGSALTYLRRYGLSAIVGAVADDVDDDGEMAQGRGSAMQDAKRTADEQRDNRDNVRAFPREQSKQPAGSAQQKVSAQPDTVQSLFDYTMDACSSGDGKSASATFARLKALANGSPEHAPTVALAGCAVGCFGPESRCPAQVAAGTIRRLLLSGMDHRAAATTLKDKNGGRINPLTEDACKAADAVLDAMAGPDAVGPDDGFDVAPGFDTGN